MTHAVWANMRINLTRQTPNETARLPSGQPGRLASDRTDQRILVLNCTPMIRGSLNTAAM